MNIREQALLWKLINIHGWPTCARCKKPVDDLIIETEGGLFNQPLRMAVVVARCHGAVEGVDIPPDAGEDFSLAGEAFVESRLPHCLNDSFV